MATFLRTPTLCAASPRLVQTQLCLRKASYITSLSSCLLPRLPQLLGDYTHRMQTSHSNTWTSFLVRRRQHHPAGLRVTCSSCCGLRSLARRTYGTLLGNSAARISCLTTMLFGR